MVLALVLVSIGSGIGTPPTFASDTVTDVLSVPASEPPADPVPVEPPAPVQPEVVVTDPQPVPEPVPTPAPELEPYVEPVPEVPIPEPQPEIPAPEPVTPAPEPITTAPEPTTTVPETTTPAPEPTTTAEPELMYEPEIDPEQAEPEAATQATENPSETTPESEVPNIIVTVPYVPTTISFAGDGEVAGSINQFLEENQETLTEMQSGILRACVNTAPAPAGYGTQWISHVYAAAGVPISGNSRDMRKAYCKSSDRDELEPGMLIAVFRANEDPDTWGYQYGRVAVYVGNGMVVESASQDGIGVKVLTALDDWLAEYDTAGTARWGYPDETAVTPTATPIQTADIWALTSVPVTFGNFQDMINLTPSMTKEELVALGTEMYGVDARWMQLLIGTTAREGYVMDPYLYYAWACAMLNLYRWYPADAVYAYMDRWGSASCPACGEYYGEHAVVYGCGAHTSYSTVWEYVLKCIYLAMINRDYRIAEVDGMIPIGNTPAHLGAIYLSPVYDCQVWTVIG